MKIGENDLPDECPEDCPFSDSIQEHGQNAICGRCPVFCCNPSEDERSESFRLVDPEVYRLDWAAEWARWFREGMKGYPELRFEIECKHG